MIPREERVSDSSPFRALRPLKSKISSASIPVRSEMSNLKETSTTGQGDSLIKRKRIDSLHQVSSESYFKSVTGQDSSTSRVKVAPVVVLKKICIFINDYYLIAMTLSS